jgi:hypothetical protein
MHTVCFSNQGEIDAESITSFGVSVKEGSSPIGFFGTGLKYAIAVLLRLEHRVTILSGQRCFEFGLHKKTIRGVEFDFVAMTEDGGDPVTLGFTTELGKQWEPWMAYREIACNCKDENGSVFVSKATVAAKAGETTVIVTGEKFAEAHSNRHQYLLESPAEFASDNVEVRDVNGWSFFYRGVRVQEMPRPSLFTYNSIGRMELTEDRTLKHQWDAEHAARRAILRSDNRAFIRKCIMAGDDTLEGGMDYHGWSIAPSQAFLEVVGEAVSQRRSSINDTAVKLWRQHTKQPFSPNEIGLTRVQLVSLERAIVFLEKIGFCVRDAYPIKFTDSLGAGCLGFADMDAQVIWIAERVFEIGGTKQLAATLMEEFIHLRHGWLDMTREMQNFLFEKVVSLGEEVAGEPL